MKIYHVGGIYYSVLASSNCGPGDLGKQLADDVPADLNDIEGNYHSNPQIPPLLPPDSLIGKKQRGGV